MNKAEQHLRYHRDPRVKAAWRRYRDARKLNETQAWADTKLTLLAVRREYGLTEGGK